MHHRLTFSVATLAALAMALSGPSAWAQGMAAPTAAAPMAATAGATASPAAAAVINGANATNLGVNPSLNAGATPTAPSVDAAPLTDTGQLALNERAATPATTLFQDFVATATGRRLPVFGQDLFRSPATFAPVTNIAPPADYQLGAGDEVQLQVWGAVDVSTRLVVDRDGVLMVPRVGALSVAGLKVRQLESALRAHVGKVFKNFDLSATVSRLRSIQVYVVGQARRPGTYTLSSLSTLINALFASGGPSAQGSMRAIELRRNSRRVTTIDLYDFILKGDQSADVSLQPGDVIVVPPIGPQVAVTGAFDHSAIYELKGDTAVGSLLNAVGGVPALAAPQLAQLERVDATRVPARQVQQIALNAQGLQTPMRDGDILTLMPVGPAFANEVTLRGAVAAPARYPWRSGMRVRDLIPSVDALVTLDYYQRKNGRLLQTTGADATGQQISQAFRTINWGYAVVERLNKTTLQNELIPFNLGAVVLKGEPQDNLELLPGDVVTVFNDQDIRLPQERQFRLVTLEGEVAAPGVYPALPGETLPQLLRRVGGLTPQAYLYGATFSRAAVREQQQRNLDRLIAQLESELSGQTASIASNASDARANAALARAQAAQARQRQELQRLKTLRSSGRVALELPSDAAQGDGSVLAGLPPLPLEDGDRLVVPAQPAFVAAFGAFNSENVIVYKPGRTVADVYRLAGAQVDGDFDRAFVLRADGSVVSATEHDSGWMGSGFEQIALMPGDTVVVPRKVDQETAWTVFTRNAIDITQIISNLGLGLAALRSL
jgi:protein involved in polysaccharide export with SLBB domain